MFANPKETSMKVAILVDGDFYLRRHQIEFKKKLSKVSDPEDKAKLIADDLMTHCLRHLKRDEDVLYRIFFYDCPPLSKKLHNPISKTSIDLSKTSMYKFRTCLHKFLVRKPSMALRLGYLDEHGEWKVKPRKMKEFLQGKLTYGDLCDDDVFYHARQKGVDMKIGLDIATLTHKKLVDKIILISGDSDFVPASKLARREGIYFALDPMGHGIKDDLHEHIDYLSTTLPSWNKQRAKK